jgi:deoxyribose-phosphate aldolase
LPREFEDARPEPGCACHRVTQEKELTVLDTCESLASLLDHTLLSPELTETQVAHGCELAKRYQVATAVVRPCDIDVAVRILGSGPVKPASVAGFPHGDQNTGTKLYEARDLLRRGAREIDMVLNISKLLSRQFQHVETEILQMSDACHKEGAKLKVIFETAWLTDELKIVAARICARAEADFVQTATGFGPAASPADLQLLRKHVPEDMSVKAAGGIEALEQALEAIDLGAGRIGTTGTAQILDAWKLRLQAEQPAAT